MIPGEFQYHRPGTLDEVVSLLSQHGDDAQVLAGGHSLIPMMKLRMASPEHLIDLQSLDSLRGIEIDGETIRIGALTSQHDIIASRELADACPILAATAELIADPQVRYCGTMGGNVANGDPGNDMPALMQALDADYHLLGSNGSRTVKARDFYEAAYFTAMEDEEFLTAVSFARPASGHLWAYEKLKRKVGDYATAAAAVILEMDGGQCRKASVSLTNVAATPLYADAAARTLEGSTLDAETVSAAVDAAKAITEPAADMRGPADYRTHVAGVMLRRAIAAAQSR
ncbi:FAD binding domain-containing protein [Rhodovibrionaceae bacterium A322]